MGIYGLQSWGAYWAQQLRRENLEELERLARWRGRLEAFHQWQLQQDNDVEQEPMACPRCRREYAFGGVCSSCDVELVGRSFVDSAVPTPAYQAGNPLAWMARKLVLHAMAFAICIGLTAAFLFTDPRVAKAVYAPARIKHVDVAVPARDDQVCTVPLRMVYMDHERARHDVTPGLSVEIWSQAGELPELHLLAPGGTLNGEGDCHPGNCTRLLPALDWGERGEYVDDPLMWTPPGRNADRSVHLLAPQAGRFQVVLLHPGGHAQASSRVYITVGGMRLLMEQSLTLDPGGSATYDVDARNMRISAP